MMKRYAIIEIPERISLNQYLAYGAWYPILTGPVELMQTATKEAGMIETYSVRPGDYYFDSSVWDWGKTMYAQTFPSPHFVIPAPEPEPENPCPICQKIQPGQVVNRMWDRTGTKILCWECGRPEAEWTYATDPGGIGGGGTGGPL
jgi:hypothetical protein